MNFIQTSDCEGCKKRVSDFVIEELLCAPQIFGYSVRSSQRKRLASPMNYVGVVLLLWIAPLHSEAAASVSATNSGRADVAVEIAAIQNLTDDLRGRLEIAEKVDVTIVDHNPLVMSVETMNGRTGPFVITVDREFAGELTHEELEAALAHELGHVWIYTHHPFLQTERLANDVAMRVISRSAFEPVYAKVWQRMGIKGNLVEFLGPPSRH
jgi:hypothetical protein